MISVCLDLNVWCAALLAFREGRGGTATQTLVDAVRTGQCARGDVRLVVSWGMLERLRSVLVERLEFSQREATETVEAIADMGASLTLGGVGVLALDDLEDRHVLEAAWAADSDILVTANLRDFVGPKDEQIVKDRAYRLKRGRKALFVAHPFWAVQWLRGGGDD